MNASPADSDAPNCWQCQHFSVSWDPNLPYACRLMGFKTRIMPALEVLRADGTRCRGYTRKTTNGIVGVNDALSTEGSIVNSGTSGGNPGADATAATSSTSSTSSNKPSPVKGLYSTFNKLA